jgi:hypothetical protein
LPSFRDGIDLLKLNGQVAIDPVTFKNWEYSKPNDFLKSIVVDRFRRNKIGKWENVGQIYRNFEMRARRLPNLDSVGKDFIVIEEMKLLK